LYFQVTIQIPDMPDNFDAIIYDMDGLLTDSEPLWRQVEIKVFQTVGLNLSEEDCLQTTGYRFDEVVEHWWHKQNWTGKTKQEIHDEVIDEMENVIRQKAVAMPGVMESLAFFKSKGKRMALASSSAMRLIKATVEKLDIENYFEFLVSAEHEKYGKPHPAVFLRTSEMMETRPEKCLVIEDSLFGLLAAKSAKMKCIVIPDAANFANPKFILADWKLKSLYEVPGIFSV
jgi:mannitol-1-/sugar-/sorbitol-6-/2-deoxyglucose-6-phosphatase